MKPHYPLVALLAVAVALSACSREKESTSFGGVFEKLRKVRDFNEAREYYTGGTIDAVNEAVSDGVIGKQDHLRLLPLFNEKTRWDELSRTTDGSRGTIRIRYTAHPVENMIGFEMNIKLRKEGGSWKVDLEDDIRQGIQGRASGNAAEYIQKIKRKY